MRGVRRRQCRRKRPQQRLGCFAASASANSSVDGDAHGEDEDDCHATPVRLLESSSSWASSWSNHCPPCSVLASLALALIGTLTPRGTLTLTLTLTPTFALALDLILLPPSLLRSPSSAHSPQRGGSERWGKQQRGCGGRWSWRGAMPGFDPTWRGKADAWRARAEERWLGQAWLAATSTSTFTERRARTCGGRGVEPGRGPSTLTLYPLD